MIMRILSPRRPGLAAAVLAVIAAAGICTSCASPATPAGRASPAAGSGFPVTFTAANGKVHVKSRPTAIISLSPTVTEMLYAIGAGGQVKAVDDDSDYPPQAPRTRLSGFTPNVEAIVAYRPDLVVISNNIDNLAKRLAAFSVPVLELPAPATVSGVYTEFDQLGRATGHLAQARREDVRLRTQIKQIVAAVPHRARPLTYYYELEQDYYSITSSTFVGSLLSMLGMKSIADGARGAAAAGGYPQLSAEYILKSNPDYIILADTVCCHQNAATVAARPGWSVLRAVREHHIILLNDDIASRWGPRIVDLLRDVARGISGSGTR
jgi:iron complex transport system substrate-binding protein